MCYFAHCHVWLPGNITPPRDRAHWIFIWGQLLGMMMEHQPLQWPFGVHDDFSHHPPNPNTFSTVVFLHGHVSKRGKWFWKPNRPVRYSNTLVRMASNLADWGGHIFSDLMFFEMMKYLWFHLYNFWLECPQHFQSQQSIFHIYIYVILIYRNPISSLSIVDIPVVPHKAVAEVSKTGNLQERLVVVNHGWQSESTDGPTGGWSFFFWSGCNGCSGHLTTTAGCSVV